MMKVVVVSCLLALASASPAAEADADPQYLAAPIAYHTGPAPNCVTEDVILITHVCTPKPEEVCSTEIIPTQEIEYEKICTEIVDNICDAAPVAAYHHVKRDADADAEADAEAEAKADADAEADAAPLYYAGPYAHSGVYDATQISAIAPEGHVAHVAPVAHHVAPIAHVTHHVAPVAHAVAHSVTATVKHACREVTTEHCVDNPKVIEVPVEVEHCHTITKVTCDDVENKLPKTTCEAVVTTETQHAAIPVAAPVAHHPVPVAHHAPLTYTGYHASK